MTQPTDATATGTARPPMTRRRVLQLGAAGAVAAGGAGYGLSRLLPGDVTRIGPHSPAVLAAEHSRKSSGAVIHHQMTAQPTTVDFGGRSAKTWTFDGALPAPEIRLKAGQQLRVDLTNNLSEPTTVHWHGLALRNDMDGVPGLTMDAIQPGHSFRYQFTVPDPGTYWFHPHVGVQLDTGLMGALIVEDPHEPLSYDQDVTLLLDDWTDGIGKSPATVLADLGANGMQSMAGGSMGSMGDGSMAKAMGGVDSKHPLGQDTGDVRYPLHLINGHPPRDPFVLATKPGHRVRMRLINAGSDTAYRFALGGHRLLVVASDGFPVQPTEVDTLIVGMGERYDLIVTAQDGAFPIISRPEGKPDQSAFAVMRSGSSATPTPSSATQVQEMSGQLLRYSDLRPTHEVTLTNRQPARTLDVNLQMRRGGKQWLINGKIYRDHTPLDVKAGERVRLRMRNQTPMFHPMHLHGHTFAVVPPSQGSQKDGRPGIRKDTVNVLPMQEVTVDVQADNPGQWLLHCHNAYHGELGMMTVLSYVQ